MNATKHCTANASVRLSREKRGIEAKASGTNMIMTYSRGCEASPCTILLDIAGFAIKSEPVLILFSKPRPRVIGQLNFTRL